MAFSCKSDEWVCMFEVPDTKQHQHGYTVYKVSSTVFLRSNPASATSVEVWKRYSEIRKLHRSLRCICSSLGLANSLPSIPPQITLNRFDEKVINSRRKALLNLLNFCASHTQLITSDTFNSFLQATPVEPTTGSKAKLDIIRRRRHSSTKSTTSELALSLGIEETESLYSQVSGSESDESHNIPNSPDVESLMESSVTSLNSSISPVNILNSLKLNLNGSKPVSSNQNNSTLHPNSPVIITTNLPVSGGSNSEPNTFVTTSATSSYFSPNKSSRDPLNAAELLQRMKSGPNSCCSASSTPVINGPKDDTTFNNNANFAKKFPSSDLGQQVSHLPFIHDHKYIQSESGNMSKLCFGTDYNKKDQNIKVFSDKSQPYNVYENSVHNSPKNKNTFIYGSNAKSADTEKQTYEKGASPPYVINVTSASYISPSHETFHTNPIDSQYLCSAEKQITEAKGLEQNKNLTKAFQKYHQGIATLLHGVQDECSTHKQNSTQAEPDGSRREVVKKKTLHYLQRAEQIMTRLTKQSNSFQSSQQDSCPNGSPIMHSKSTLKSSSKLLSQYCIARIVNGIMVAKDRSRNNEHVAIKVVPKKPGLNSNLLLPSNIPFMVPILRYHETDTAMILVLKYIKGGTVLNQLECHKSHLNSQNKKSIPCKTDENVLCNDYVGKKLLCDDVNSSDDHSIEQSLADDVSVSSTVNEECSGSLVSCDNCVPIAEDCVSRKSNIEANSTFATTKLYDSNNSISESYLKVFSSYISNLPSPLSSLASYQDSIAQYLPGVPNTIATDVKLNLESNANQTHSLYERDFLVTDNDCKSNVNDGDIKCSEIIESVDTIGENDDVVSIGSNTLSGLSDDFSCSLYADAVSDEVKLNETTEANPQEEIHDDLASKTKSAELPGEEFERNEGTNHLNGDNGDFYYDSCSNRQVKVWSMISNQGLLQRSLSLMSEPERIASDVQDIIKKSKKLLSRVNDTLHNSKSQAILSIQKYAHDRNHLFGIPKSENLHTVANINNVITTDPLSSSNTKEISSKCDKIQLSKVSVSEHDKEHETDSSSYFSVTTGLSLKTDCYTPSTMTEVAEDDKIQDETSCKVETECNAYVAESDRGKVAAKCLYNINGSKSQETKNEIKNIKEFQSSNSCESQVNKESTLQNLNSNSCEGKIIYDKKLHEEEDKYDSKNIAHSELYKISGIEVENVREENVKEYINIKCENNEEQNSNGVFKKCDPKMETLSSVQVESTPENDTLTNCGTNDTEAPNGTSLNDTSNLNAIRIANDVLPSNLNEDISLSMLLVRHRALGGTVGGLPEGLVRVWVSQMVMALQALHGNGIVWGDFNPSNVLLDEGGGILVTYECRWGAPPSSCPTSMSHSFITLSPSPIPCGELSPLAQTLGYIAPELNSPLCVWDERSDWWSLGAFLYHLLTFKSVAECHPCGVTSHTELMLPSHLSLEATVLISKLLVSNPDERLQLEDIRHDPFFHGVMWPDEY